MVAQLHGVIDEIDLKPPPLPREEVSENRAFLQWLAEDHFLLLGYRRHDLATIEWRGRAAAGTRQRPWRPARVRNETLRCRQLCGAAATGACDRHARRRR